MKLQRADLKDVREDLLSALGGRGALLTVGDGERDNTMTIGWGQVGRLWNLPVCTVYVRPERYTDGFMQRVPYFSVSVLPSERRDAMALCGTKSGRDMDKIAACALHLQREEAPFPEEAELALVCRTLYVQDLGSDCVRDGGPILPFYGQVGGWHRMYTGEIIGAYKKV